MGLGQRSAEPRRGAKADLLVVGLGNPGERYARTRHNAGAWVIEELARRHGERLKPSKDARAQVAEVRVGDRRLVLAVPTTFMNDSGAAVAPLCRRFGIDDPQHLVIAHDELDLPPGRVKLKVGGGLAGNNGLRSITAHLKTQDYLRLRVGVGKPPGGAERGVDHVLSVPSKADRELIEVCVMEAADAVDRLLDAEPEAVMVWLNARRDG